MGRGILPNPHDLSGATTVERTVERPSTVAMSFHAAPTVGGARVKSISKSMVSPADPTSPKGQWMSLSNLDRVVNPTFCSVILFYKNALETNTFQDVSRSLKSSLAKVLVDFYPLAGKLALRDDGLVDVLCNDEGAVFIEASVEMELMAPAVGGPQPMPALSGLELARLGSGPRYIPDQLTPIPALVVQLTKFLCGSVAIAINWHHTVADGSSGCHFLKSWSEVAAGKPISVLPNHDRSLLRARNPPDPSLVVGYSTKSINPGLVPQASRTCSSAPVVLHTFHIAKAALQGLKEKLIMEDDHGCQFTSAESISAHLWQEMTKSRADNSKETMNEPRDLKTRFFMFVDGRKRLGLPAGYFGNAVCSACAVCDEDDILNQPLSYVANLIRTATRNVSAEYFRSLIDWVEIQGNASAKSEHVNSIGRDVAATFWTFFPLYDMDFGWGRPDLAIRNSPPRPLIDGIAMMPSADGPGHMLALLNLHADRMDRLQRQSSFKTVFAS